MKTICTNKKAYFNYFISDKYTAGIVLVGSEVKSVRNGHISLEESFVQIVNGELFLKNAYIKPYENTGHFIPDPKRNRKLLLNKTEIIKIQKMQAEKGNTILPLKVFFAGNYAKVEIGIGKGKKLYDKRETLKERTIERNLRKFI